MDDILKELELYEYRERLIAEGFDSWDTLHDITEADLSELGFKLGHRRKLQRAIAEKHIPQSPDSSSLPALARFGKQTTGSKGTDTYEHMSSSRSDERMATNRPKRRYKRHPKTDRHAPDRPLSAYVLFSNSVRDKAKSDGRELGFADMAKIVGERWQTIPAEEREQLEQHAAAQKAEYNRLMAEYKKTEQYHEYERYLSDFKSSHSQSGRGEGPSDEESTTKKTRRSRGNSTGSKDSKDSKESRLSLDVTRQGNQSENVMSPCSVGSSSDIYSADFQNARGTSPSGRTTYHGRTAPLSPGSSSSNMNQGSSSSDRRPSARSSYQHLYPHSSTLEYSTQYQTYSGLPNYAPTHPTPHTFAPSRPQQGAPLTGFERTAASSPSSNVHMSFRTLPPVPNNTRTAAGVSHSQPSHHQTSNRQSTNGLEQLIAAAESQAPIQSPNKPYPES